MVQPRPLFVYFRSFQTQFVKEKTVGFWGIRTRIVGVEGEHADNLTTTTANCIKLFVLQTCCCHHSNFKSQSQAGEFIIGTACSHASSILGCCCCRRRWCCCRRCCAVPESAAKISVEKWFLKWIFEFENRIIIKNKPCSGCLETFQGRPIYRAYLFVQSKWLAYFVIIISCGPWWLCSSLNRPTARP